MKLFQFNVQVQLSIFKITYCKFYQFILRSLPSSPNNPFLPKKWFPNAIPAHKSRDIKLKHPSEKSLREFYTPAILSGASAQGSDLPRETIGARIHAGDDETRRSPGCQVARHHLRIASHVPVVSRGIARGSAPRVIVSYRRLLRVYRARVFLLILYSGKGKLGVRVMSMDRWSANLFSLQNVLCKWYIIIIYVESKIKHFTCR